MVVLGGVRFLMSEVPLYHGPHTGHWCCRHARWGHYTASAAVLGLGVWGWGGRVESFRSRVSGFGFSSGFGFCVLDLGSDVSGFEFRALGFEFCVSDLRF